MPAPDHAPKGRYDFGIFNAAGVRREELAGTPYRYWHSHAIAQIFAERLSGTVDILDAGGGDAGTLNLLHNLELRGTYTCLDIRPTVTQKSDPAFEIAVIQKPFKDFSAHRQYDAFLFQTSLEYVADYRDIGWTAASLKPGGFAVVILHCRNTGLLYRIYWRKGGRHCLDEDELAPAFAAIGLRMTDLMILGGAASRCWQYLAHSGLTYYPACCLSWLLRGSGPRLRHADILSSISRRANPLVARLDYLFRFWRTGHCIVLEPSSAFRNNCSASTNQPV